MFSVKMRYSLVVILYLVFFDISSGTLQAPRENKKDDSDKKENKSPLDNKENRENVLKVVAAPDLTKDKNSRRDAVDLLMIDQAKILQKMVEELDLIKTSMMEEVQTETEELPPEPEILRNPPELSPEQAEAHKIYMEAATLINKTRPDKAKVNKLLQDASDKGSLDAKGLIAWGKLLGNTVDQDINAARDIFMELADKGHAEGHTGLGFLYSTGLGVNISQAKSLVHYTFGAIGGHTWAQMILGYKYWSGISVPSSCEKSLDFYRQVADKVSQGVSFGGGAAIQRIRLLDEHENGYSSGIIDNDLIEYYQLLAEKGDIQAQVGLGQLHYQGGRGVELDYQKALHYFTQAANAGNAVAMAYLGKIYLDGSDDVKADNATAFRYFKKASDLNNPVGLSGLGLMYLYGRGVEKDYAKAHKYFLAAADQGWVDGQLQLGIMYLNGLGVRKDFKMANKFFSLASQSGHVLAYYNLGNMHAYGNGMLRSCPTAVELFKSVAERGRWGEMLMQAHSDYRDGHISESFVQYALLAEFGYEVAQSNAAFLLDKGEVSFLSPGEALTRGLLYWGRAAAQGYSAAQVKLGDYYYYGMGTQVDFEVAATHYRLASEQQHNAQAMFNLGYMHEHGLGMTRDMHLAKRLYDLAAETSSDAKVPVALALLKLNFVYTLDTLQKSQLYQLLDVHETISSNWDLYLITLSSVLVAGIIYFRRPQV